MPLSPDYFLLIVVVSGLAIIIMGGLIYMVRCSCSCCPCCTKKLKKYGYGEGGRKGSVKQGHGFYTSPTFAISSPEMDHMVFHQISQQQLYGDFLGSSGLHATESSGHTGSLNPQVFSVGNTNTLCETGWMSASHHDDAGSCAAEASNDDMIMFM